MVLVGSSETKTSKAEADTIVVPDDYPTIQEAINNAHVGGTVFVKKGTYRSPPSMWDQFGIVINKSISLIGEDPKTTIIDGVIDELHNPDWGYTTIRVDAPDVTISGFTITNCENSIHTKRYHGELEANNCKIIGNNFVNNSAGIAPEGSGHVITENNITNAGGVWVYSGKNITISSNNITGAETAVFLLSSRNVTIKRNNISNNEIGVFMEWWGPFHIYENNITDNQKCGIQFNRGTNNSTVYDNRIENNGIGFRLINHIITDGETATCSGNMVFHNNMIDNSQQVVVGRTCANVQYYEEGTIENGTATVSWDNGEIGNYWSDYQTKYPDATEIDNTGKGNTPYIIDQNNTDYYPLINPIKTFISDSLKTSDSLLETTILVATAVTVFVVILVIYRTHRKRN